MTFIFEALVIILLLMIFNKLDDIYNIVLCGIQENTDKFKNSLKDTSSDNYKHI